MKIKIWLIRHGMTAGNRQQRYVGTTDELLCEEGRQQIILKRQLIKSDQDIQNVYVSPMLRCRETAEILFPAVSQIKEAGFRECSFGEFEYRNYQELNGHPDYQAWIDSNGILAFPGGESKEECAVRNLEGFQRAVTACIREAITEAALVVHGGTIMNIMEKYALPKKEFYEWHIGNGCGYLVELDPVLWKKDRRNLKLLGEQK